ncbi:MAG: hypothetical protein HYW10_05170, partial [Candidatus Omnitrophica bacterium]|nr:hypothetical protein [Candidatus Omnitrophota bacterium]
MKKSVAAVVVLGCALSLTSFVWAKANPSRRNSSPATTEGGTRPAVAIAKGESERQTEPGPRGDRGRDKNDLQRYWDDVKSSLKQGAYRDALQSIDIILSIAPNDPRVPLYRSLCERRLQGPPLFAQLSPAALTSLKERLHQEEQDERRSAAQQKALERLIRNEQVRWDQELKTLQQQAEREEKLKRQQAQAEEISRRHAQELQRRAAIQPPALPVSSLEPRPAPTMVSPKVAAPVPGAPAHEVPVAAPPPALSAEGGPFGPPGRNAGGGVELAPVVIRTPPEQAGEPAPPATPTITEHAAPPPGAVQINARQMNVSSNQNIAVAEGEVEVLFENAILTCDHLTLFTDTKDVYAEGRVRLQEGSQVFRGEMAHYNFNTKKGRFLQGTLSSPPWHEHGRSVEHLAEGVFQVTPGYLTSCELEPPHFKFFGRRAVVFADDKLARAGHFTMFVEQFPLFYLPWMTVADRQSPFFIVPGKNKQWETFALMGYRYEVPDEVPGPANQRGTIKLDWRRAHRWGGGVDHRFDDKLLGKGLLKLYYNESRYLRVEDPKANLPKGAVLNRHRAMWRHRWLPMPDTTVITDIQTFSDANYRKDFLFREEFSREDAPPGALVSVVTSAPDYSVSGVLQKRMDRFETATNLLPELSVDAREQRIGETQAFTQTKLSLSSLQTKRAHSDNDTDVVRVDWFQQFRYALSLFRPIDLQTKRAHSDNDTDVVRVDWFQQFRYALSLFRPIEVTPRAGIRQTFHTKDKQGGAERPQGKRDLISGQFSMGSDASLKLFRIFPVTTNALGLDINWLRHVLTPTLSYSYVHRPTVPSDLLSFSTGGGVTNRLSLGLENKLQTKRPTGKKGKLSSYDLGRFTISLPYTFRGSGNKVGGELGDWSLDLETTPWPWLSLENDWVYPSHFTKGLRDSRVTTWNTNLTIVNPKTQAGLRELERRVTEEAASKQFQ